MGLENPLHIVILLTVVLLLFGAKRLPEMGRSLGEGMRGFKEAINPNAASAAQPTSAPVQALAPAAAPVTVAAPVSSEDLMHRGVS